MLVATSAVDSAAVEEGSPVEVTAAVVEPAAMLETAETVEAEAVVIAESVEPPTADESRAFSQMYDFVMSHFESSHFSVLSILTQS